jgi:hypothetical protein
LHGSVDVDVVVTVVVVVVVVVVVKTKVFQEKRYWTDSSKWSRKPMFRFLVL